MTATAKMLIAACTTSNNLVGRLPNTPLSCPYAACNDRCSPGGPIMSRSAGNFSASESIPLSHAAMNVGICWISFRVWSTTGGARIQTSNASAPSDPKIAAASASPSGARVLR